MNILNIKRALEDANVWFSCLEENSDVNIVDVTTVPSGSDMHDKLVVLTTGNIKQAEEAVEDWSVFINVILDSNCSKKKYLRKLSAACNLLLVSDIGKAVGTLHEALRR